RRFVYKDVLGGVIGIDSIDGQDRIPNGAVGKGKDVTRVVAEVARVVIAEFLLVVSRVPEADLVFDGRAKRGGKKIWNRRHPPHRGAGNTPTAAILIAVLRVIIGKSHQLSGRISSCSGGGAG